MGLPCHPQVMLSCRQCSNSHLKYSQGKIFQNCNLIRSHKVNQQKQMSFTGKQNKPSGMPARKIARKRAHNSVRYRTKVQSIDLISHSEPGKTMPSNPANKSGPISQGYDDGGYKEKDHEDFIKEVGETYFQEQGVLKFNNVIIKKKQTTRRRRRPYKSKRFMNNIHKEQ